MFLRLLCACAPLFLIAMFTPLALAQTTVTVSVGPALTFSPATLTINAGDTVNWVWNGLGHNVVSGNGSPNGAFNSGTPVGPPNTFSITFDSQFLSTNPMPNNTYPYYCTPHLPFGMTGTIIVTPVVVAPSFVRGDCDDDGSLSLVDALIGLNFLFVGGATPTCLDACDFSDDESVGLPDIIGLLNFLFVSGPAPSPPAGACGVDPTAGTLDCTLFSNCP